MAKKNLGGRPRTRPKPGTFDREVGRRIMLRSEAAGMSQADMARALKKSPSQAYRYFSGDTSIDTKTLAQIASVLGCTVGDLVDGIRVKS